MLIRDLQKITIIGSGLGGCFLALLLEKEGYKVEIYEKLSKNEICDTNAKRSVSLTLYGYGLDMLRKTGLWKYIKPHLVPLSGSMTQVTKDAKPIATSVDQKKMPYYCISRPKLITMLLEQIAKKKNIKIHYQTTVLTIDRYKKSMMILHTKTKKSKTIYPSVIIGADGANSYVRSVIQSGQDSHHSQEYAQWTYKQFHITKQWVKQLQLLSNTAYTWARKDASIAAFPNKDGSLAALLILPTNEYGFSSLTTNDAIQKRIADEFPTLVPFAKEIATDLLANPEGTFVTIHTDPWYYKDFMTIIGDGAHGFYPFFGQGASAAFGDSMELVKLLRHYGPNWGTIFPLYQQARKTNMDALGEVSKRELRQYLRYKRADYEAIYNAAEALLHNVMPKVIKEPIAKRIVQNPQNTATYVEEFKKQRTREKYIGFPIAVKLATLFISFTETTKKYLTI